MTIYEAVRQWKERPVLPFSHGLDDRHNPFYTLMATKYVTYTYISIVPAIILSAMCALLVREGEKASSLCAYGGFFFLIAALVAGTIYIKEGSWLLFLRCHPLRRMGTHPPLEKEQRPPSDSHFRRYCFGLPLHHHGRTSQLPSVAFHHGLGPMISMITQASITSSIPIRPAIRTIPEKQASALFLLFLTKKREALFGMKSMSCRPSLMKTLPRNTKTPASLSISLFKSDMKYFKEWPMKDDFTKG